MSIAASLFLAAAVAAQSPSDESGEARGRGAQVASAEVRVQILRPAILRDGSIDLPEGEAKPRVQTLRREGRVTYEFE